MKDKPTMVFYAIKYGDKYIKDYEANKDYCNTSSAPTMGTRYTFCEFSTILDDKPIYFERMTFLNMLKILTEEIRWGRKNPLKMEILTGEKSFYD